MTNSRNSMAWSVAVSAVMLSPIVVIFSIPLMIGIGLDVIEVFGKEPFALALCAPLAFVLSPLFSPSPAGPRLTGLMQARLPLRRPEAVNFAPKSIG